MLVVGIVAVLFAVSNREPVMLEVWPLPFALDAPIYAVALASLALGVLWGGLIGGWGPRKARRRAPRRPVASEPNK
jgi:hypothetical protein